MWPEGYIFRFRGSYFLPSPTVAFTVTLEFYLSHASKFDAFHAPKKKGNLLCFFFFFAALEITLPVEEFSFFTIFALTFFMLKKNWKPRLFPLFFLVHLIIVFPHVWS